MHRWFGLLLAAALSAPAFLDAQVSATPEDPAHNELRALRTQVLDAIKAGDVERTLTYVHPNVVVTWQNQEVCRGQQGVRDFYNRMGKDAFRGYKVEPTPDELTILYGGDTGISFGKSVASYRLLGKEYEFTNRWTATVVKENGRWLLASYHVSNDTLDNPLVNVAKQSLYWVGGIGFIAGLASGVLVTRRRRGRVATQ
jgi:ketosteroid isomerase-like protein